MCPMSQETRRAIAFIGSGCLAAGIIGFGVWQFSEPANFSTASQVQEAGHTQTSTTTITESASPADSTTNSASQDDGNASRQTLPGSDSTLGQRPVAPQNLAEANEQVLAPRGTKPSRRAQIDAADPFLPPHAVLQENPDPVQPTVVYRPRGFEALQPQQQQGTQGGSGSRENQEPQEPLVIAEPKPAQQQAPKPNSPADNVAGAIPKLADLDPQPLINETLDRAGLTPNNKQQPGNQQPAESTGTDARVATDPQAARVQRAQNQPAQPDPVAPPAPGAETQRHQQGNHASNHASDGPHDAVGSNSASAAGENHPQPQGLRDAISEALKNSGSSLSSSWLSN